MGIRGEMEMGGANRFEVFERGVRSRTVKVLEVVTAIGHAIDFGGGCLKGGC